MPFSVSIIEFPASEQLLKQVLNLILSTLLSREVNVALLYGRYIEKEASYFVRDPAWPAASALPELL